MIGFYQQGYMHIFSKITTKISAVAALILTSALLHAQDYARTLNWLPELKTINTIDGKTHKQPSFSGAYHSDTKNLIPVYSENIPIPAKGNVSAQIVNATYEPVSIDNETAKYISTEVSIKAELSAERKRYGAQIEIIPFRKSGAGVERLKSFTLRVTVTPVNERRSGNAFASSSVLAGGTWYKVAVSGDGVYKLDFAYLKNVLNVDPGSINVNRLAVYSNGAGMVPDKNSEARYDDIVENPTLFVDANSNNVFEQDDYLLFYAGGPDAWKYNSTNQTFVHEKNLFSDKSYCYITTDAGTGKRIQNAANAGTANKTITEFDDYAFNEKEEENSLKSGRIWLGDKMTRFSPSKDFSFNFPNLVTSSPVKFISSFVGRTPAYGSNTAVQANGQNLFTHAVPALPAGDYTYGGVPVIATQTFTASNEQINVSYTFTPISDVSGMAAGFIDWFELHCKRGLSMSGNAMQFRSIASVGAGSISEFRLGNANGGTQVWDVTDMNNIQRMPAGFNGSELVYTANTETMRQYVAVNVSNSFGTPEYVGKVGNQNLHGLGQPDMVIVTYDDFEAPSNDLAEFHRTKNGISVSVVKLSQIYEEFACGKPDFSAIRDMMRMLYERAGGDTAQMPRYLLLMGDGSYDPRNRIAGNKNFVPTYESYESYNPYVSFVSDDFFGMLDPNEGGDIDNSAQKLDVAIGRIPVETAQEAWGVVNKIKNYKYPSTSGPQCTQVNTNNSWRNMLTFIADDYDDGGTIFTTYSDRLSNRTFNRYPSYNLDKIYLDAYKQISTAAGARYPDVNTAILNRINSGTLIVNWVGHGGETNWAHERIFNMADIVQLKNIERLPLFITATCEFSRYDLPDRTAGEWLVVNSAGGGIAAMTTVRLVYQSENERINDTVMGFLFKKFEGRDATLGEIMVEAKNSLNTSASNYRKFTLLGDPAMALNYPKYDVITTEVNNEPIGLPHDTLKALSRVTIKGEIRDEGGTLMNGFNGVVYPIVYDKIAQLKTLANDASLGNPVDFQLYKNLLFKGKASVTNGQFSFTFIVPKDIDYQYGNGRISYYADNGNFTDAHGYTNQIIIGGAADTFTADAIGPKMNIYMNDEKFVFGGTTNEQPILLVKMEDESGINTAGNGIGHDLVAILDNQQQSAIVLNDYYESELDDYQRGNVRYPFSKLKEGTHTLKVKSWDIHNNSSEDYTEFVVASNAKLALSHVYNYPNPFTTRTQFMFEHNRPCDNMDVTIQIYTVSGKMVKSIHEQVTCDGFRVNDIAWDGRDEYGDAIGKGVYVYKLNVRDSEGNSAHKFEKLVVLR